ncbi:MAG: sigma-70 family RNA polymerase sigma factor [Clostridiales Family XIII bacterium]|jgi:RNA polymerase sigma-70 factor (ECF subfamily)|nr:sigma-70 family RNA polymerase sigma factor [Clostridiales Family XIII bacterium]
MEQKSVTVLVSRAMNGEAEAIDELYLTFAKTILYNVYNMIIDKENVEDVAQEVAMAIVQGIGRLNSPYAFTSWLHRMIFNVCSTHNKQIQKKAGLNVPIEEGMEIADENIENIPHSSAEQKDVKNQVLEAIATLPDAQRISLVMYYYDEMSYKEIAEALEVTGSTVSTNIRKAKKKLENILGKKNKDGELEILGAAIPLSGMDSLIAEALKGNADSVIGKSVANRFCENASQSAREYLSGSNIASNAKGLGKVAANAKIAILIGGIIVAATILVMSLNGFFEASPTDAAPIATEANEPAQDTSPYLSNAEIVMERNGEPSNVNPTAATLTLDGTEANIKGWNITDKDDAVITSGEGATIQEEVFESLPYGEYKLSFSVESETKKSATVRRTFFIAV